MKNNIARNRGFIKTIIIIVIAIVILSYYGIDLRDVFTSEQVQSNLHYAWGLVLAGWDLFIKYVWEPILDLIGLLIN